MTSYAALSLSALLLLSFPLDILKFVTGLWLASLLLLAFLVLAAWLARAIFLPIYDPALYRLLQHVRENER